MVENNQGKRKYIWIVGISLLITAAGCGGAKKTDSASESSLSARQVFQKMLETYGDASTYADRGVVRLRYRQQQRLYDDEAPLRIRWQKPNKLLAQVYTLTLACDGSTLRAKIEDPDTNDFDQQMLVRSAPDTLAVPELYAIDELVHIAFRQGLCGYPVQLDMLLADNPLEGLLAGDPKFTHLPPQTVEGSECFRVEVTTKDGRFVFWIDAKRFLLRRLEFPAEVFAAEIAADPAVTELSLTAEFVGATLNEAVDGRDFELPVPDTAKQVQNFVPPPDPLPSELIGRRPAPFQFTAVGDPAAQAVAQQDLDGKIAVLVWFNNHPACVSTIQQLHRVQQSYSPQDPVVFLGVCSEPATVTDREIQNLLQQWNAPLPVVRDLKAYGRDVFRVPWAPTMVVLDRGGRVQIFEVGANPDLEAQLPVILQRLVANEDLAAELLERQRREMDQYHRALTGTAEIAAPDNGQIVAAFPPQKIPMQQMWRSAELKSPGNLLVISNAEGKPEIVALDGWQTIARMDLDGNVLERKTLELSDAKAVSYFRTFVAGNGQRYFLGSALRTSQMHLFDGQWNRIMSYPRAEQEHDGIHDAQLGDLDHDGTPEIYAGFWGLVGIHCVSLDGRRQWSNRSLANILTLAVTPLDQRAPDAVRLLATSDRGKLIALDSQGQQQLLLDGGVHHLYATAVVGWQTPYCTISYATNGGLLATGLAPDLSARWTYELPRGTFQSQVQFVQSAAWGDPGTRAWVLAAPDGTVHLVGDDGERLDHFGSGAAVTGLAWANRTAGPPVLLVASPQAITAWQITGSH